MNSKNSVIILMTILGITGIPIARAADDTPKAKVGMEPAQTEDVNSTADLAGDQDLETAEDMKAAPAQAAGEVTPPVDVVNTPEMAKAADAVPVESAAPPAATKVEEAAPSSLVPAATEAAKAEGEKKESLLEKYPPQVKTSQWGPEIRINVIPDSQMGTENVLAVQSVKLETEKGEYLGLKTFQPEEKTREAEFMINPEILKIDAVKITVSSKIDGQWTSTQTLKNEEGKGPEAGKPDAVKPAAPAPAKPKKKGWWG